MAKKLVAKKRQKPGRKVPVARRTDWSKMRREVRLLLDRLQCQPSSMEVEEYDSVIGVLGALLDGKITLFKAEDIIKVLSWSPDIHERTDWENLKSEIKERVERLAKQPEERRRKKFMSLETLFVGAIFGDLSINEAADKAREMTKPPALDATTPEQILRAYANGRCSIFVGEALINQLIADAKDEE